MKNTKTLLKKKKKNLKIHSLMKTMRCGWKPWISKQVEFKFKLFNHSQICSQGYEWTVNPQNPHTWHCSYFFFTKCIVHTLKRIHFLKYMQSVNVSCLWSRSVIYPAAAAATVGSVLLRSQTGTNQRAFGETIIDLITSSTAATSGPK